MKDMFIIMVADVHVDCAYNAHFEARALPQVYGSYAEASKAAKEALREYRDAEVVCISPEDNRVYADSIEVEYIDA